MYKVLILVCLIFAAAGARASEQLFYFEGQEIFGYSSAQGKTIYSSMDPEVEMQKPGLGFDYLRRFSGEAGDVAVFALQGRLAVKRFALQTQEGDSIRWEPQLYNAFLKVRTPVASVWVGHNRTAFGMSSYLNSHALLLQTLSMQGFSYDHDWGAGAMRDFSWGDVSASVTTGTGMPIYTAGDGWLVNGNYLTAARASYGVLARDNYTTGLSASAGRTLDTIGYTLRDGMLRQARLAGADAALVRDNLEHRFEVLAGKWLDRNTSAFLYRFGINLDAEERFKIEAQPVFRQSGGQEDTQLSFCVSIVATPQLTVRTAYVYDSLMDDNRIVAQLYYYSPM